MADDASGDWNQYVPAEFLGASEEVQKALGEARKRCYESERAREESESRIKDHEKKCIWWRNMLPLLEVTQSGTESAQRSTDLSSHPCAKSRCGDFRPVDSLQINQSLLSARIWSDNPK